MKKLCMILPVALVLCFMVGCEDRASLVELEKFQTQADVEEQNIALVKHFYEGLNKGNVEIWKEVCAPDFAYYSPSGVTEPLSLEKTIDAYKMHFKGFSDLNWSMHDFIAKGDKVIARFSVTGTHSGEWQGIPVTGNKVKNSVIAIFHIRDGKCVEVKEEVDVLGIMMQLGMELKPKEDEK